VAHELLQILDRIEFWGLGGQRHQGDIGRQFELRRDVRSGLVEDDDGMASRIDGGADLLQVLHHGKAIGSQIAFNRHHED